MLVTAPAAAHDPRVLRVRPLRHARPRTRPSVPADRDLPAGIGGSGAPKPRATSRSASRSTTAAAARIPTRCATRTASRSVWTTVCAAATSSPESPASSTGDSAPGRSSPRNRPSTPRRIPRPPVPDVGGDLVVSSFNVLNYFTTLNLPGSADDDIARGAESPLELSRQQVKILDALAEIDADIFGLIEIENNGGRGAEDADRRAERAPRLRTSTRTSRPGRSAPMSSRRR